jgi:flagellar biosynthetic protein FlhB
MAEETDDASKTEEPTAKKLSDARAKGEVPKSPDISQLASLSGAFGVVVIAGGWLTRDLVNSLTPFLAHAGTMDVEGGIQAIAKTAILAALPAIVLVMMVSGLLGAASNLSQSGFIISPENKNPDQNKLDLV